MITDYEKRLGANIGDIREAKGLTQEQVVAQMQLLNFAITRSALAKIEVGQRHIRPEELKALKEIFHISFDELFPEL